MHVCYQTTDLKTILYPIDNKSPNPVNTNSQITGVEGYVESASMGLLASLSAVAKITQSDYKAPPKGTALGALINYLTTSSKKHFQPMNINFGLFWTQEMKIKNKQERNQKIALNALDQIKSWRDELNDCIGSAA